MLESIRKVKENCKKFLQRLYPEGVIPVDALMVCLAAVFISRFYILREARSAGVKVTPLVWLFKQVYFSYLNYDPWWELTKRILGLIGNSSDIEAASTIFSDMLDELKLQVGWDGIVIRRMPRTIAFIGEQVYEQDCE
ncbi:uncharacterized protein LOC9633251 [Selaginella moellendorffii]|uniref:uncharacterized protein LOC9633251 n=1 Tax=Selaginella moellendorffii TaxID=88036 RepID=UPI000D1C6F77|nr:uncharacterized protein LOC9633251 [Selaginella moellendorffii]|eukprot:XP_024530550.1 uncharacterized protein LOC9633251 [Selaginella moellendorffii]